VNKEIDRNYLEIFSLRDLVVSKKPSNEFIVELIDPANFQLNKFFYKNIGKKHRWFDRLVWTDKQWINYTVDKKVKTYVLKKEKDLVGYYELISHTEQNEIEIAYLGVLEEYQNQKLGSFLLTSAIQSSFLLNPNRVWVHTCSLDHKNALDNYLSRGMKIFKKEKITV
jgi:ribosomal protein S18 acetylase RimI-like enzyme